MPKATIGLQGGKQLPSFPGKQTEALQGRVTFSRLQNWEVVGSLGLLSPKAYPPSYLLKKTLSIWQFWELRGETALGNVGQ